MNNIQKSTYIIAEVGVNHNGNFELAAESIKKASETGADAVKFQSFKTGNLVSKTAGKAAYQIRNTGNNETQFEMLSKLELTDLEISNLKRYCEELDMDFISSPFDVESATFLKSIGVEYIKIGSGEITNLPLLKYIDTLNLSVILSTGMSTLGEVEEALACLSNSEVIILHCTSDYPSPFKDVNLKAMVTMGKAFNKFYGYSDHTVGNEVSVAAVTLGAQVIEKHFTLDKELEGPDHKSSLNPTEFKQFVSSIRNVEIALGDGRKRCMPSEEKTRNAARKSIVMVANLEKGSKLEEKDLAIKRPGEGIQPKYYDLVIGKELKANVEADQVLKWEDLI